MSAYQANVKVEQLAEGESARTPGSIVASSTTSGNRAASPPTPSLPAGGAFTSSRPEAAATGTTRGLQSVASSVGCRGHPLQAGSGRSAWPWYIGMKRIKAKPTIIEMKIYQFG